MAVSDQLAKTLSLLLSNLLSNPPLLSSPMRC
jgi:hypothetical protein